MEEWREAFQRGERRRQTLPERSRQAVLGAVRDIDYLKHSLEQIAASREKTKKEEDWTKELAPEEMKVLGELIRQYFSAD